MPPTEPIFQASHVKRLPVIACLTALLSFVLSGAVSAAPPVGAETCAECHQEETEAWQDSPHAHALNAQGHELGATCENCHGPYVEDHPATDVMQLAVDSSSCQECHTSTFQQWEQSIHAQNGVQCIGCHLSHSQEFRLSDEDLCAACHRERLDTAHGQADVSCIDCHLSATNPHEEVAPASAGEAGLGVPAASHDFTAVLAKDCVSCHGQDVHKADLAPVNYVPPSTDPAPDCRPEIIAKLEAAQRTNKSLQTMTPLSLGLGMGIGGMLGIIFMLILGYINQTRGRP
ncbi:MAG: cytochrome c3 family protein [Chloroflexota bacterium]